MLLWRPWALRAGRAIHNIKGIIAITIIKLKT